MPSSNPPNFFRENEPDGGSRSEASNRRTKGRLRQESLGSSLGTVLDLSASGMRILSSSLPKGQIRFALYNNGETIHLVGEVAWTRRRGLFKREAGIRFIDVDDKTAKTLAKISLQNTVRRHFHQGDAA